MKTSLDAIAVFAIFLTISLTILLVATPVWSDVGTVHQGPREWVGTQWTSTTIISTLHHGDITLHTPTSVSECVSSQVSPPYLANGTVVGIWYSYSQCYHLVQRY